MDVTLPSGAALAVDGLEHLAHEELAGPPVEHVIDVGLSSAPHKVHSTRMARRVTVTLLAARAMDGLPWENP